MVISANMTRWLLISLVALLCVTCDLGIAPDSEHQWYSLGVTHYSVDQLGYGQCFYCQQPVRLTIKDNRIVNVVLIDTGDPVPRTEWELYETIDGLFGLIRSVKNAYQVRVQFDSTYGYPRSVWINPSEQIQDEEIGYLTSNLVVYEKR